jgi:hypothetical protein
LTGYHNLSVASALPGSAKRGAYETSGRPFLGRGMPLLRATVPVALGNIPESAEFGAVSAKTPPAGAIAEQEEPSAFDFVRWVRGASS